MLRWAVTPERLLSSWNELLLEVKQEHSAIPFGRCEAALRDPKRFCANVASLLAAGRYRVSPLREIVRVKHTVQRRRSIASLSDMLVLITLSQELRSFLPEVAWVLHSSKDWRRMHRNVARRLVWSPRSVLLVTDLARCGDNISPDFLQDTLLKFDVPPTLVQPLLSMVSAWGALPPCNHVLPVLHMTLMNALDRPRRLQNSWRFNDDLLSLHGSLEEAHTSLGDYQKLCASWGLSLSPGKTRILQGVHALAFLLRKGSGYVALRRALPYSLLRSLIVGELVGWSPRLKNSIHRWFEANPHHLIKLLESQTSSGNLSRLYPNELLNRLSLDLPFLSWSVSRS